MKRGAFCVLMILGATALVFAKGPTTKITIGGAGYLNTHSIFRGCESNWFRANAAWQTAFRNVIYG